MKMLYAILSFGNYVDVRELASVGGSNRWVTTRVYRTDPRLTAMLLIPLCFQIISTIIGLISLFGTIVIAFPFVVPTVFFGFFSIALGCYCLYVFLFCTRKCHPSSRVWVQFYSEALVYENTTVFYVDIFMTFVAITGGQIIKIYATCEQGQPNTLSSNMLVEAGRPDTTKVYLSVNFALRVDVFNRPWTVQQTLYHDFIKHPDDHLSHRVEREALGLIFSTCDRELQTHEAIEILTDVKQVNEDLKAALNQVMDHLGFEVLESSIGDSGGEFIEAIRERASAQITRKTQILVARRRASQQIEVATAQAKGAIGAAEQEKEQMVETARYTRQGRVAQLKAEEAINKQRQPMLLEMQKAEGINALVQLQPVVQYLDQMKLYDARDIVKRVISLNADPSALQPVIAELVKLKDARVVPETLTYVGNVDDILKIVREVVQKVAA